MSSEAEKACPMSKAPMHTKKFKRDQFLGWLERQGAQVLETTNPWELVRYKAWMPDDTKRPSTHIVYARGDGTLTYTGASRQHYEESGV